ncbi:AMP-binding protein [Azospirillum sp. sgz302134]
MSTLALSRLFTEGRDPAAPVAFTGGERVDFARFRADVAGNAARLARAGCRRGLLVTQDAYWGAVGLFSLLHAGAEAILPPNGQPGTLAALAGAWDLLLCERPPGGAGPVLMLEPGGEGAPLGPLDPAAPVTVFTSGSTGEAKRIAKTLALLEREAETLDRVLGPLVPADARVHGTVTHQHVYGLAFRLCWPLASGRVIAGPMHELWEGALAALSGGDVLVTSPAHLTRLEGIAPLDARRRPSLVLSAGAPLAEEAAWASADRFGMPVTEIFGSTETGAIALRHRAEPDPPWRPLPGIAVEAGEDGLLRVRTPFVAGDGLFQGADRIQPAGEGGFRLLGRADRIVKIEGKRVSLPEVEDRLRALPEVAEAVVIDLAHPAPRLAAAVVPSADGAARLAELGAFRFGRLLRRALAATQEPAGLPRQWRFVEALPSGPLGKRRRADIASLFEDTTVMDRPTEPDLRAARPLADGVELELFLPADLAQLDGHFPGMPIVPGVAQIDWAAKLAARHLGVGDGVARRFQVKFRRVTVPDATVTLTLRHVPSRRRLSFEYRAGEEVLSSGSIALEEP